MALSAKNKIGFIDGSILKPSATLDPKYSQWVRCNDIVLSWILNSLSKDLTTSVIYAELAYDVWRDLKERFSQSNAPRIFQIQRAICSLAQEQTSVAAYFSKFKGYWDELLTYQPAPTCSCGAMKILFDYQQHERIMQF